MLPKLYQLKIPSLVTDDYVDAALYRTSQYPESTIVVFLVVLYSAVHFLVHNPSPGISYNCIAFISVYHTCINYKEKKYISSHFEVIKKKNEI